MNDHQDIGKHAFPELWGEETTSARKAFEKEWGIGKPAQLDPSTFAREFEASYPESVAGGELPSAEEVDSLWRKSCEAYEIEAPGPIHFPYTEGQAERVREVVARLSRELERQAAAIVNSSGIGREAINESAITTSFAKGGIVKGEQLSFLDPGALVLTPAMRKGIKEIGSRLSAEMERQAMRAVLGDSLEPRPALADLGITSDPIATRFAIPGERPMGFISEFRLSSLDPAMMSLLGMSYASRRAYLVRRYQRPPAARLSKATVKIGRALRRVYRLSCKRELEVWVVRRRTDYDRSWNTLLLAAEQAGKLLGRPASLVIEACSHFSDCGGREEDLKIWSTTRRPLDEVERYFAEGGEVWADRGRGQGDWELDPSKSDSVLARTGASS